MVDAEEAPEQIVFIVGVVEGEEAADDGEKGILC